MGAFTAVLTGFLNETQQTMKSVMTGISAVDTESKMKLKEIDMRSTSEGHWVGANLNKTITAFNQFIAQSNAIQSAMRDNVHNVQAKLKADQINNQGDTNNVDDTISQMILNVTATERDELTQVRRWIAEQDPEMAKTILGNMPVTGSLLQTKPTKYALIQDIRKRMNVVRHDLAILHHEEQ
jgi:hypothetical protein